jgi:AbrB family looped-hinge helix DNA binding protein
MSEVKTLHSTLRDRGQVTIPAEVREALDIRPGDEVVFSLVDGVAVISAGHVVPKSQAWFWTQDWQAGEAEASRDIATRRIAVTTTAEEFFGELDR